MTQKGTGVLPTSRGRFNRRILLQTNHFCHSIEIQNPPFEPVGPTSINGKRPSRLREAFRPDRRSRGAFLLWRMLRNYTLRFVDRLKARESGLRLDPSQNDK